MTICIKGITETMRTDGFYHVQLGMISVIITLSINREPVHVCHVVCVRMSVCCVCALLLRPIMGLRGLEHAGQLGFWA